MIFLWNCSSLPFAMCLSSSKVYNAPEGSPHMLWSLRERRASGQIIFNVYLLYKSSGLEVSQQNRAKKGGRGEVRKAKNSYLRYLSHVYPYKVKFDF